MTTVHHVVRVVDAPIPDLAEAVSSIAQAAENEEARLARLVPSAFWLDGAMARPLPVRAEEAPVCPSVCGAFVLVMANDAAGRPALWSCTVCGKDYDRGGRARWKGAIARRRVAREMERRRAAEMRRIMKEELAR